MSKSKINILVLVLVFITQPLLALAGVPDLPQCEVSIAYPGPGTPSLMNVPDGDGNPFTAAHDEQGNLVDATITLYLRDAWGTAIANFPFEDMWLESADGGVVSCHWWGIIADQNTDINGMTMWANPPIAG